MVNLKSEVITGITIGVIVIMFLIWPQLKNKPTTEDPQNQGKNQLVTVSPKEFSEQLKQDDVIVIDVRTESEFRESHIQNAANVDYYQTEKFDSYLNQLDKQKQYMIYCRSGHRAGQALEIMKQKGFTHVTNLAGGISAWIGNNYPVVN
ncbi:rhodanese-like domain-containing protein [candidate division WWE3 bacterium]|nr:rhodanese-like domain-containing protein [candidate division WWE3 bacterium]